MTTRRHRRFRGGNAAAAAALVAGLLAGCGGTPAPSEPAGALGDVTAPAADGGGADDGGAGDGGAGAGGGADVGGDGGGGDGAARDGDAAGGQDDEGVGAAGAPIGEAGGGGAVPSPLTIPLPTDELRGQPFDAGAALLRERIAFACGGTACVDLVKVGERSEPGPGEVCDVITEVRGTRLIDVDGEPRPVVDAVEGGTITVVVGVRCEDVPEGWPTADGAPTDDPAAGTATPPGSDAEPGPDPTWQGTDPGTATAPAATGQVADGVADS